MYFDELVQLFFAFANHSQNNELRVLCLYFTLVEMFFFFFLSDKAQSQYLFLNFYNVSNINNYYIL